MKEIWRKVLNYDDYEISNLGNIRSLKSNKILKTSLNSSGYKQIILCKNGKTKCHFIHRLVAETFISNINQYKEINHKDENKQNNCVDNLEWCNHKYNMNYGDIKNKISNSKNKRVAKYNKNKELLCIYGSIKNASIKNNANSSNIVACCKHKENYKTCKGFIWEYV